MECLKRNWAIILIIAFMLVAIVYVLVYGENIYIPIHDNLEDVFTRYNLLKNNQLFWSTGEKVPILGGLDRNSLPSDLKLQSWIYMIFPAFIAYIFLLILKVILSVAGGSFLGKILLKEDYFEYKNIILLCSFIYSLAPNCPAFSLCFGSLPLFFAIMVKFYYKSQWYHYLLIFTYAFISDLTYFGIFICGYILLFFLINWVSKKRPKWELLSALFVYSLGLIIVEWRLFSLMLVGDELIRIGMDPSPMSFLSSLKHTAFGFIKGHYHSADLYRYQVGIPCCPQKWAKFGGSEGFSGNGVPGRKSSFSTLGYKNGLKSGTIYKFKLPKRDSRLSVVAS